MPKKTKKKSRVDVNDLEKPTKKLSKREQKNVKGGLLGAQLVSATIGGALNTVGGALNTVGGALNTVGGALGNTVGGGFGGRNP